MKTGYEDFFKKARHSAANGHKLPPRASVSAPPQAASKRRPESRAEGRDQSRTLDPRGMTVSQVEELRARMKTKPKRKAKKFPKSLLLMTVIGFILAGVGFLHHEEIDSLLSRLEVGALPRAQAAEDRAPAAVEKKAVATETAAPAKKASELTPDEINHLQKLVERKEELDAREEELRRLEAELTAQKTEMEKKMKSLEETRTSISGLLSERSTQDQAKVDSLVQMYSTMKPAQAAKVLESMDEDLAVEIIGKMKKKNAAEVLNLMKAEKAQMISEKFAGYRKR